MSDYQKNHSSQQLLDRIVRLERENERVMENIRANNVLVASLQREIAREVKDTTLHIEKIHEYLKDIHDVLWPVTYKVFPEWAKESMSLKAFLKSAVSPPKK